MYAEFTHDERVAYFSMEIALRPEIPTYSGGLGILAGDALRSAADLDVPLVAVTLASRAGYFHQILDTQGNQHESAEEWNPAQWCQPLSAKVAVEIEQRVVWVGGWLYVHQTPLGGRQPVVLLDTDIVENAPTDREITHYLYGGDAAYRLKQEIVLGLAGMRMLEALGFSIREYHLNEGHSAFLTLHLLGRHSFRGRIDSEVVYDVAAVRRVCNFTTHTPVEAGHDRYSYELVERTMGKIVDWATLRSLGGANELNMTLLALNLSEYVNGVAKRHAETSARLFPGYQVRAITNGVHPGTWTHPAFAQLYDANIPGWRNEPELLVRAGCCIPHQAIGEAHEAAKRALFAHVHDVCGVALDVTRATLGYARRMTQYKRPELLFTNPGRLRSIARRFPLQILLAGKAHPRDEPGKALIRELHRHARELADAITIVYLPNYDMRLAQLLIAGVDIWLNTPLPPFEASGTSGMKAAFNGVPHLSVLDGWWVEGCIEGVTGWAIGKPDGDDRSADAASLYEKLEQIVLPTYYHDRAQWLTLMQRSIAVTASLFNSHRMMRRYASDAYLR